ncbi:hypothetical protein [Listeria sp. PSOL-1]|uniref:hypothetical protein n=1 Tax=Listeria sp. PSOL-1 TaxID=1844999 RepID=UPI0013D281C8|nr:hypothetical protein [Listeria sp. PSOL-1]
MNVKKVISIFSSIVIITLLLTQSYDITHANASKGKFTTKIATQNTNFIKNGTFNDGITNWDNLYPEKAQIINENNNNFLRIATGSGFGHVTTQKIVDLEPYTAYTLSFDSKEQDFGLDGIGAFVALNNNIGEIVSGVPPHSPNLENQSISLKTTDIGELTVFIFVNPEIGDGQADFDNFTLLKTN